MKGEEVVFICGTDEHGTAITVNAEQEDVPYADYVARWRAEIKSALDRFGIVFDHWSGTSICPDHAATSQEFFRRLDVNGYLLKRTSEQLYCPKDEMFLADRYILGTCYECGYEMARGNECPRCGKELDPLRMANTRCKVCGTPPVRRETLHWYLDLPKLRDSASAPGSVAALEAQRHRLHRQPAGPDGLRPITRDRLGHPVPRTAPAAGSARCSTSGSTRRSATSFPGRAFCRQAEESGAGGRERTRASCLSARTTSPSTA
jgi:methionyl-tRNA synthetase